MSAFATALELPRVKDSVIRAHLDWVRDYCSRDETIELFEALPPAVRQHVATMIPGGWYDLALLLEVDRTIVDLLGNGDPRFLRQVGAWCARNVAPIGTLHDFFRRRVALHRELHTSGTLEYLELGASSGVMCHVGADGVHELLCAAAAGYYAEAIVRYAGAPVVVSETECRCRGDVRCRFDLAWR